VSADKEHPFIAAGIRAIMPLVPDIEQ